MLLNKDPATCLPAVDKHVVAIWPLLTTTGFMLVNKHRLIDCGLLGSTSWDLVTNDTSAWTLDKIYSELGRPSEATNGDFLLHFWAKKV